MSTSTHLHSLLLLSDSALPLGSFAFSSGLESFLHHKSLTSTSTQTSDPTKTLPLFNAFLSQSLQNLSSTALPYVLTAFREPERLEGLDNDFDASTGCTVARRASVMQGRAMVTVWERALWTAAASEGDATKVMNAFVRNMKIGRKDEFGFTLQAHLAPLFGVVCKAMGLGERETGYLFLLNHVKAVLSAGVRAGVSGPYQSQGVLVSKGLQESIQRCLQVEGGEGRTVAHEEASVTVPMMDLWMGRHELLYSRIFNS